MARAHAIAGMLVLAALVGACGQGDAMAPEHSTRTADREEAPVADAPARPGAATAGADQPAPESDSGQPLLIVFTGDFCPPCRVMKPWVDEVARDEPGVAVARVNVDRRDSEPLVTFFQVESVPTLVFASASGEVVARRVGLMDKAELLGALREQGWVE